MSDAYTVLPAVYDALGEHPDYDGIAEAVLKLYQSEGAKESGLILDLCCGTGRLTRALADRGAEVIAVDSSVEMLNEARKNCARAKIAPLLLCQDMRSFELYGTVDVCVCAGNSLNYLTGAKDLEKVFGLVHNYLTPGGLFLFDMDTLYKFEKLYADNSYVFENDGCFCVWQNAYEARPKRCRFYIDVFFKEKDGRYLRRTEEQVQKYYSVRQIGTLLKKTGFELLGCARDYRGTQMEKEDADVCFTAKCIK